MQNYWVEGGNGLPKSPSQITANQQNNKVEDKDTIKDLLAFHDIAWYKKAIPTIVRIEVWCMMPNNVYIALYSHLMWSQKSSKSLQILLAEIKDNDYVYCDFLIFSCKIDV